VGRRSEGEKIGRLIGRLEDKQVGRQKNKNSRGLEGDPS
jgi:hypothetical protein